MNRYLRKAVILLTLTVLMVGCTTKEVEPDKEMLDSNSIENIIVENDVEGILSEFESVKNSGYGENVIFIDENIRKVPVENGSEMVLFLLEKSKSELENANNFIYGDKYLEIDDLIRNAYDSNEDLFENPYSFFGNDKIVLMEKMKDSPLKDELVMYLNQGLGLYSAEGSYYFGVDYAGLYNNYFESVATELQDYLGIMVRENADPLTVEEYLAVSITELGKRAVSYENYLINHPNSINKEDVMILLNVSVWKLVNPSPFDSLVTDDFKVNPELMSVYQELVLKDDSPVIQNAVKGIMAFVDTREDGVLGSWDDMDALYEQSYKLHDEARLMIEELYR